MQEAYVFCLFLIATVAFLLFSWSISYENRVRGLSSYCAAVGVWALGLLAVVRPILSHYAHPLVAAGGFVVAGFLHAAYDLLGESRRKLLWAAYGVAALILVVQVVKPALIFDPTQNLAGPYFWPSVALAFLAATLPTFHLLRSKSENKTNLTKLSAAGFLGYGGAASHIICLTHGKNLPYGILVVLVSMIVLADLVRDSQPKNQKRVLDQSLLYAGLMGILSTAFVLPPLLLLSPNPLASLDLLLLVALSMVAFEPFRRHVAQQLSQHLTGKITSAELVHALAVQEERADQSERLAELGRLTSAVAHEVRGPLGVLSAQLRVMELDGIPEESTQEMREQIARAEHFVADMLEYGRPKPLELREVDLVGIIRLAETTSRQALQGDSVLFEIETDQDEGILEADQSQILQIFTVLFDNAILSMVGKHDACVQVQIHQNERHFRVLVQDNGPGISPQILPRVFEPFVTGRKREGRRPGTGLGLAIAKGIVQRHGGTITATNKQEGGASFEIYLPIYQRARKEG